MASPESVERPASDETSGGEPEAVVPRRRGSWAARCPSCRCLAEFARGALECACGTVVRPLYHGPRPTHATGSCHPNWEDDHRLDDGTWDRYSRVGRLGRRLEELERRLDADAAENIDRIQEIAATLRGIREDLRRHGGIGRRQRPSTAPATTVTAMRETWIAVLCWVAIELDNARLRRGGRGDEITKVRGHRAEPFGGYRHALSAAFGTTDERHASSLPGGAIATHRLPRGVQFGRIAVRPTRASAGSRSPALESFDAQDAIDAARIGVRTRCEHGRILREPGRPLTPAERELVRLVDAGEAFASAKASTKNGVQAISRDAVEYVHPREAVRRVQGLEGAPRTEREARLVLKAARHAIALQLEDRGLIPPRSGPRRAPTSRTSSPRVDPFAGIGGAS